MPHQCRTAETYIAQSDADSRTNEAVAQHRQIFIYRPDSFQNNEIFRGNDKVIVTAVAGRAARSQTIGNTNIIPNIITVTPNNLFTVLKANFPATNVSSIGDYVRTNPTADSAIRSATLTALRCETSYHTSHNTNLR